ncbi:HAD family phosphatase [Candidatus Saccharibacteria bacterium]|nr:HAD family phosphatase [Candidatus Saccharibacteria bacterium]
MQTFKNYGVTVPIEELHSKIGSTNKQVFEQCFSDRGVPVDIENIVDEHEDILFTLYKDKAELPEGLKDFLEACKKNDLLIGLSSATNSKMLKIVLEKFGISTYFDVVIGGESVSKGKPDPEMIQKALEKLHVRPEQAIAIDDARSGIIAAKSIDMFTIAYLKFSKQEIPEADSSVWEFNDIKFN